MRVIKRIGVNSAFKVGAMLGLITSLILGLFVVGLQGMAFSALAGLASMSDPAAFSSSGADMFTAFGMAGLCIFYVIYVVMSAIFGGITGLVVAVSYNLSVRWIGGLEIELDDDSSDKSKHSYDFDDIYE